MSNKELFKTTNRRKSVEWTSPSSGAKFTVMEPTATELTDMIAACAMATNQLESGIAEARYVWTHLVTDPETGAVFTEAEFDEILSLKGLTELGGPEQEILKMIGWKSPAEMQGNLKPSR